ncbi:MAG: glycosyltransferase family 2 protein [Planctomycetota bacterium]|nr:MAG: glycosyltransferase family 2 protein [Planctomycetota bacterium]
MRLVAIVPTYRNIRTLPAVLDGLSACGLALIVVDDGSDDGTDAWARAWCEKSSERTLISLPHNQGKGAALAAGLALARQRGFDAALTVDSDGQHRLLDAQRMARAAREHVLLLGKRSESHEGYPAASMFGRRLWALGIRALTGLGVQDPICGLRCYPLAATDGIVCAAGRYAWEEEFLVRCAWSAVEIEELKIETVYQDATQRVSHFGWFDWIESILVFIRLAGVRVFMRAPTGAARGVLARRDRSWRRLQGMAVFVAGVCALCAPLVVVVPTVAFLAWRLHASMLIAVGAAIIVHANAQLFPASIMLFVVVLLALAVTRAARFLCSN